MTSLPERNPENAAEIYRSLIVRIRQSVKDKVRIVYDPMTGIQKSFLDGKLVGVKYLKTGGVYFDKDQE